MFFIAYAFKGQAHVFAGRMKIVSRSLVLQDKRNIEIVLSPDVQMPLINSHADISLYTHIY